MLPTRDPVRDAAARGRVAARADGGRRPRHVRGEVPRRRAGPQDAGRRGDQRRSWPERSGCRCRTWSRSTSTRRWRPASRTRRCRTCCAPAAGSTSGSTTCPARSTSTRRRSRWTPGWPAGCCGSTRWSATSTGPGATRTCCTGTAAPYLIDHGATLTFQHSWADRRPLGARPYDARDHVLIGCRPDVAAADAALAAAGDRRAARRRGRGRAGGVADRPPAAYVDQLLARVDARGRGCRRWSRRRRPARAIGRRCAVRGRAGWAAAVTVTRHVFEYAVLRVVPRVDRGESMNAGVLLYCRPLDYLGARVHLDVDRLRALDPAADPAAVEQALRAAADICGGEPDAGPAGAGGPGQAVPLADRAAQHGRAARAGPHRTDRRPRRGRRPAAPAAGAAGPMTAVGTGPVRRRSLVPALVALAVLVTAAARLAYLLSPVMQFNADEATTGIMVRRILDGHGYVFYAGQDYGGTLEQYLEAAVYAVFRLPPNELTLRLPLVALCMAHLRAGLPGRPRRARRPGPRARRGRAVRGRRPGSTSSAPSPRSASTPPARRSASRRCGARCDPGAAAGGGCSAPACAPASGCGPRSPRCSCWSRSWLAAAGAGAAAAPVGGAGRAASCSARCRCSPRWSCTGCCRSRPGRPRHRPSCTGSPTCSTRSSASTSGSRTPRRRRAVAAGAARSSWSGWSARTWSRSPAGGGCPTSGSGGSPAPPGRLAARRPAGGGRAVGGLRHHLVHRHAALPGRHVPAARDRAGRTGADPRVGRARGGDRRRLAALSFGFFRGGGHPAGPRRDAVLRRAADRLVAEAGDPGVRGLLDRDAAAVRGR